MKSKTSQPDFVFFSSSVSMLIGKHRAGRGWGITNAGVLKQHKMEGEWSNETEGLHKGVITVMNCGI